MGIFTQIAQILMTKGIQSGVANKMISLKYLGTIYALAIGYLIFGESYGIMSLIGITMVIAGVVLNLWKKNLGLINYVFIIIPTTMFNISIRLL